MPERDRQRRFDATPVPEGFDPATDLEPDQEVRYCHVCATAYLETIFARRKFCSYRCKTRAATIRLYMKENGYDPDLDAYVKAPTDFPPINPLRNLPKTGKPLAKGAGQDIPTTRDKNASRAAIARQAAEADKARASRAKTQKEIARIDLEAKHLEAANKAASAKEREAITKAAEALDLLPLSEQPDVLTGKVIKAGETEAEHIRSCITTVVTNNIAIAEQVLLGKITWSPSQATLFSKLLNKVVPDVPSRAVSTSSSDKPLGELTVQELEALVNKAKEIPHVQTTEK